MNRELERYIQFCLYQDIDVEFFQSDNTSQKDWDSVDNPPKLNTVWWFVIESEKCAFTRDCFSAAVFLYFDTQLHNCIFITIIRVIHNAHQSRSHTLSNHNIVSMMTVWTINQNRVKIHTSKSDSTEFAILVAFEIIDHVCELTI